MHMTLERNYAAKRPSVSAEFALQTLSYAIGGILAGTGKVRQETGI